MTWTAKLTNHVGTAYQIDSRILPNPVAIQRSLERDDPADLDKPAIPVPENETRHAPINRDTVHIEIVVTQPNQPSSQQHRKEELPMPNHDPITESATSSSETGDESRNPAPVNRAIAGMSAGLVGVMVIFTVFL